MKIAGMITEYNPFHKGHKYHIEKTREITGCDVLVAVMSGHFVQRGEPAVIDKWSRVEAALENGVDLVIELPFAYAVQSAKQFAIASVELLSVAGVSDIVFGSETNNLEELMLIASMPINVDAIKENLKSGAGYPKAYGLSAGAYFPNDILGIAYIRAMKEKGITPHTIQRTNAYHGLDLSEGFASAGAIRNAKKKDEDYSGQTPLYDKMKDLPFIDWSIYYPFLRWKLLTQNKEDLSGLFLFDEGIENHLTKQAEVCDDWDSFLKKCVTRRYTKARIQRVCTHLLVHTKKSEMARMQAPTTLRILGFNDQGRNLLKELKEKEVRVASRFNQIPKYIRELEYRATLAYVTPLPSTLRNAILAREIAGPVIKTKD